MNPDSESRTIPSPGPGRPKPIHLLGQGDPSYTGEGPRFSMTRIVSQFKRLPILLAAELPPRGSAQDPSPHQPSWRCSNFTNGNFFWFPGESFTDRSEAVLSGHPWKRKRLFSRLFSNRERWAWRPNQVMRISCTIVQQMAALDGVELRHLPFSVT